VLQSDHRLVNRKELLHNLRQRARRRWARLSRSLPECGLADCDGDRQQNFSTPHL
jgi:hypothetical protein